MEIDNEHDPLACRTCQIESIAHYASEFERSITLEESGHGDVLSGLIMADIAPYWTDTDTRWLQLTADTIAVKRALRARQPRRKRGFWKTALLALQPKGKH